MIEPAGKFDAYLKEAHVRCDHLFGGAVGLIRVGILRRVRFATGRMGSPGGRTLPDLLFTSVIKDRIG
jgi:hypothetical protein